MRLLLRVGTANWPSPSARPVAPVSAAAAAPRSAASPVVRSIEYRCVAPPTVSRASALPVAGAFDEPTRTSAGMSNPMAVVKLSTVPFRVTRIRVVWVPEFGGV